MKKARYILSFILAIVYLPMAHAQLATALSVETPYYVNLNHTNGIHEVKKNILTLEYHDSYGGWKEIPIRIYNWKNEQVAVAVLGKSYGMNFYSINLNNLYSNWEENKIYTCRLQDESNRKYELAIRITSPADDGPDVAILVNPVSLRCDDLSTSVVEFYGDIKGGKAPFTINWVIANNEKTAVLYQPKEEIIKLPGRTSMITVDKAPDYYVLLQVKDACGSIQQKVAHVICDEKKKKVSTLFVEPLQLIPTKSKPIN